jgi:hypothetical protein
LFSCGDLIKIDFNGVLIQIIESNNEKVIGQVITGDLSIFYLPITALLLAFA